MALSTIQQTLEHEFWPANKPSTRNSIALKLASDGLFHYGPAIRKKGILKAIEGKN